MDTNTKGPLIKEAIEAWQKENARLSIAVEAAVASGQICPMLLGYVRNATPELRRTAEIIEKFALEQAHVKDPSQSTDPASPKTKSNGKRLLKLDERSESPDQRQPKRTQHGLDFNHGQPEQARSIDLTHSSGLPSDELCRPSPSNQPGVLETQSEELHLKEATPKGIGKEATDIESASESLHSKQKTMKEPRAEHPKDLESGKSRRQNPFSKGSRLIGDARSAAGSGTPPAHISGGDPSFNRLKLYPNYCLSCFVSFPNRHELKQHLTKWPACRLTSTKTNVQKVKKERVQKNDNCSSAKLGKATRASSPPPTPKPWIGVEKDSPEYFQLSLYGQHQVMYAHAAKKKADAALEAARVAAYVPRLPDPELPSSDPINLPAYVQQTFGMDYHTKRDFTDEATIFLAFKDSSVQMPTFDEPGIAQSKLYCNSTLLRGLITSKADRTLNDSKNSLLSYSVTSTIPRKIHIDIYVDGILEAYAKAGNREAQEMLSWGLVEATWLMHAILKNQFPGDSRCPTFKKQCYKALVTVLFVGGYRYLAYRIVEAYVSCEIEEDAAQAELMQSFMRVFPELLDIKPKPPLSPYIRRYPSPEVIDDAEDLMRTD
ncbi:hypothetical protein B7494_g7308 [Chlorociboria aeruginascens]|nr:hypothetical protein B7494_g7308 [Chlorociboria aeruginascens]